MATFPSINPSYTAQKTTSSQIRATQFNDGYQHRIKFGLNTIPYVWSLNFDVSEADSDTIEAFLDARGATESFDFTPPAETSSSKFICRSWTKSIPYLNRATINATFEEVFEP